MTDRDQIKEIAALERVRDQLEASLGADAKWRALQAGVDGSVRDKRGREFADSPIYKSWKLVSEAIDNLRAIKGEADGADTKDRSERDGNDAPDDLTSIRGIDAALAQRLVTLGATRYAEIAAWRADDVRKVSQALGLSREISRQNWIEQAALLQHRKESSESETTGTAQMQVSATPACLQPQQVDERVVQPLPDRIELPQIIRAIRNEVSAHEDAPSPLMLEPASEVASNPVDAGPEAPSAAVEERTAAPQSAGAVAPLVEPQRVAGARGPSHSTPQGSRIPIIAASSPVNTEAKERARQLEEARQQLARSAELADSEGLQDIDEAAVTFVIREPVRSSAPTVGSRTLGAKPGLLDRFPRVSPRELSTASYVTSEDPPEEAQVVVVKPRTQTHYGLVKRLRGGSVRRFLKTLTGG